MMVSHGFACPEYQGAANCCSRHLGIANRRCLGCWGVVICDVSETPTICDSPIVTEIKLFYTNALWTHCIFKTHNMSTLLFKTSNVNNSHFEKCNMNSLHFSKRATWAHCFLKLPMWTIHILKNATWTHCNFQKFATWMCCVLKNAMCTFPALKNANAMCFKNTQREHFMIWKMQG